MAEDPSAPTNSRSARRGSTVFVTALVAWLLGFLWCWFRPGSQWIFDLVIVPAMLTLFSAGLLVAVAVAARRRTWRRVVIAAAMVIASVVVNPGWMVAPRACFLLHRPLFTRALHVDPGQDYYGRQLPTHLRMLTVEGKVVQRDGTRFFPQWIGIPDDAGGYLYSPQRSPRGVDLFGMICTHPVDLGDGWWMCGLRDNGL
ncbi:hypothetical protein H7J77_03645 [Mycolicibacillus parakoreensis]|uniref:Uncharacterized protein n=1 Tax=Mycolicibacillus parakoreensis TaxID=1069221 RepID=A0ABY3U1L9_9MYCO|nr:hypothetical protein [Mycolicibacillus parakoreensis]MCV7314640.1 hypothetical protein [Mycolicibacillus parakoreensis]ULN53044.1 hypothetical protein MIU77_01265 [Mycolicibacillus parakoreensis]